MREPRGEICLLVQGASEGVGGASSSSADGAGSATGQSTADLIEDRLSVLLKEGVSVSAASKQVAQELLISRNAVYQKALLLKEQLESDPGK